MRVKFGDLSGWLKTAVVILWILAGLTVIDFIAGFLAGYS